MFNKLNNLETTIIAFICINLLIIFFGFIGFYMEIILGILVLVNIVFAYLMIKNIKLIIKDLHHTKSILPHSVANALEMEQLVIFTYDSNNSITWVNEHFTKRFGNLLNKNYKRVFNGYFNKVKSARPKYLEYDHHFYEIIEENESIILKDVSRYAKMLQKYKDSKGCVAFIKIDNVDDISASIDESVFQAMVSDAHHLIVDSLNEIDGILRKYKDDSYIFVFKQDELDKLIDIFNKDSKAIKNISDDEFNRLTLSVGVASKFELLKDSEKAAGLALDIALARGGDQIALKVRDREYEFFGHGSETTSKRNRVNVKRIAASLQDLIEDSSNVIIMTHKNADMDALGACIGISKFVLINERDFFICGSEDSLETNTKSAYHNLELDKNFPLYSDKDLENKIDDNTLLVIVDTSSSDLFESSYLYDTITRVVFVDHHRRNRDFKETPLLSYIEPYASSTVELVTELLNFQNKSFKIDSDEATLMLAGMMVDTSFFTLRTGVRTFEAAMFLKQQQASPLLAKEILQVSRDTYEKKVAIIHDFSYILDEKIAIVKYSKEAITRSLLAQLALELLEMKDIIASFALAPLEDGRIGVSARGNGDINVQRIMEKLGGGGHYSMAAAQVSKDINLVEQDLIKAIKEEEAN
ncbi:MAG: DHH family phosphoesterase [Bacilli bacterium]|jgi:c-di-AMP phosphodiesterase-like protein|nr:DHH family phosphoesterase [Bacilli bacterium]